jgi:hypothetical protein
VEGVPDAEPRLTKLVLAGEGGPGRPVGIIGRWREGSNPPPEVSSSTLLRVLMPYLTG